MCKFGQRRRALPPFDLVAGRRGAAAALRGRARAAAAAFLDFFPTTARFLGGASGLRPGFLPLLAPAL